MLRMMHVPGYRRIVVLQESYHHTWLAIEISDTASEEDARDWSSFFPARYRVQTTIEELLATPQRWSEIYIDGGVSAFLRAHELANELREQRRAIERKYGWRMN
jgi:hypothetical protein